MSCLSISVSIPLIAILIQGLSETHRTHPQWRYGEKVITHVIVLCQKLKCAVPTFLSVLFCEIFWAHSFRNFSSRDRSFRGFSWRKIPREIWGNYIGSALMVNIRFRLHFSSNSVSKSSIRDGTHFVFHCEHFYDIYWHFVSTSIPLNHSSRFFHKLYKFVCEYKLF